MVKLDMLSQALLNSVLKSTYMICLFVRFTLFIKIEEPHNMHIVYLMQVNLLVLLLLLLSGHKTRLSVLAG